MKKPRCTNKRPGKINRKHKNIEKRTCWGIHKTVVVKETILPNEANNQPGPLKHFRYYHKTVDI